MLTKEEMLLCAEAAERWPAGMGDVWVVLKDGRRIEGRKEAWAMLRRDPGLVRYG